MPLKKVQIASIAAFFRVLLGLIPLRSEGKRASERACLINDEMDDVDASWLTNISNRPLTYSPRPIGAKSKTNFLHFPSSFLLSYIGDRQRSCLPYFSTIVRLDRPTSDLPLPNNLYILNNTE